MVIDAECSCCKLRVELGAFHTSVDDEFGWASLLMCSACGAQHMVRIALRPEILERMRAGGDRCRVVLESAGERPVETMAALRRLRRCSLLEAKSIVAGAPLTIADDLPTDEALQLESALERVGARVRVTTTPPAEPARSPPQMQDELLVAVATEERWQRVPVLGDRSGPAGEFALGAQRCGRCAKVGTLVSELAAEPQTCPRCGARKLAAVGGWTS